MLTEAVDLAIRNTAAGVGNMITVQRIPPKDARLPVGMFVDIRVLLPNLLQSREVAHR